ncbi:MAG: metal-dependent hydrolase [Candidatus Caldarchaeum sp.]
MEPVLHFAIPFALGSMVRLGLKRSLLLGLLGILPDFDVFYMHRSISHSVIPSIILVLVSFLPWNYRLRSVLRLSALGLGSHVILDFTGGYTPVLWPLSQNSYKLVLESKRHIGSLPTLSFMFKILEQPYNYGVLTNFDAPIFTAEGLLIAFLTVALAITIQKKIKLKTTIDT